MPKTPPEPANSHEQYFHDLYEKSPLGYQSLDAEGNFLIINQAWLDTLGYTRDEVIGRWFGDFLAPEYRDAFRERFPLFKKRGKIHSEFEMVHKDGHRLFVAFDGRIGKDEKGGFKQTHCVLQDITEKRQAEQSLCESEEKFRFLFDSMSQGVVIQDAEGKIIEANPAAALILGLTIDQLLGKTSLDPRWRAIHEDGSDWPGQDHPAPQALKTGKSVMGSVQGVFDPGRNEYRWIIVSAFPQFREGDKKPYQAFATFSDITDRVLAEEKVRRQAQTIKGIIDSTGGPVFSLDTKYRYTSFNAIHARLMKALYGVELELGKSMLDYMTVAADRKTAKANVDKALKGERLVEEAFSGEESRTRSYFEVSHNPIRNDNGDVIGVGVMARDITSRRAAEVSLIESEERYRELFENMLEGFAYCRAIYGKDGELDDWEYLDVNESFERLTGLTGAEGKLVSEVIPDLKKENPELYKIYGGVAKTGRPADFEMYIKPLQQWLHLSIFSPVPDHFVAVFEDVTDRKKAETTLRESEMRLKSIIDNAPFGAHMYRLDPDDRLVYIAGNESADRILGIKCDKFIGMTLEEAFPGNVGTELPEMYRRVARTGEPYSTQQIAYDSNGVSGIFEVHAVQTSPNHMVAFFRDVTEAQRAQILLKRSEERYRSIFDHANEGIVWTKLDGEFVTVNQRFADIVGYDSPAQLISEVITFKNLYENVKDREPVIKELKETGVVTNHEVQLRKRDGSPIWISANIAMSKGLDSDELFMDGLVADITDRKLADIELRKSHENLENALAGLISTLALTVETRDPYTAEHQKRVTQLAAAIAKKAGLSELDIFGLEMAAAIHDVGKIYVPAETLNKPGKITAVEFELVKTHASAGHNIVKDIEFGQPISEIILQHHERFDGSGYPNGLKGEEIHERARILAIADVVEAMSSHRPYRPAFTIEEALDEIKQGSGTFYDPKLVDICVDLFRSGDFAFK